MNDSNNCIHYVRHTQTVSVLCDSVYIQLIYELYSDERRKLIFDRIVFTLSLFGVHTTCLYV